MTQTQLTFDLDLDATPVDEVLDSIPDGECSRLWILNRGYVFFVGVDEARWASRLLKSFDGLTVCPDVVDPKAELKLMIESHGMRPEFGIALCRAVLTQDTTPLVDALNFIYQEFAFRLREEYGSW